MENPESNPESEGSTKRRGASRSQAGQGTGSPTGENISAFIEAYRTYVKELQEAWQAKNARQQSMQAYQNFTQQYQEMLSPQDIQKSANDAYNDLVKAWQASGTPEEVQRGVTEAYNRYVEILQGGSRNTQERVAEIYRNYWKNLGDALSPKEVQDHAGRAYRNFVQAWKRAWEQSDVNALNPQALTSIHQIEMAAVQVTALAASALNQQWMATAMMMQSTGYRPE